MSGLKLDSFQVLIKADDKIYQALLTDEQRSLIKTIISYNPRVIDEPIEGITFEKVK